MKVLWRYSLLSTSTTFPSYLQRRSARAKGRKEEGKKNLAEEKPN
jgi:hypothetical protein